MFFLQAVQTPVKITYGEGNNVVVVSVPRLSLRKLGEWMQEVYDQRVKELTEGLDENRARQALEYYRPLPPTVDEMRQLAFTVGGVEKIFTLAWESATAKTDKGKPAQPPTVDEVLANNGAATLVTIALEIADLNPKDIRKPSSKSKEKGDSKSEDKADKSATDPTSSSVTED